MATALDPNAAAVRLQAPIPVGRPIHLDRHDGSVTASAGGVRIATITAPDELDAAASLDWDWLDDDAVAAARNDWIERVVPTHPLPDCYGCGHDRPVGEGLRLFTGIAPGSNRCVARWRPRETGAALTPAGMVAPWAVWSALDCPSCGPATSELILPEVMLLGSLSVRIHAELDPDRDYQVQARLQGRSGRRIATSVALLSPEAVLAEGAAVWVVLKASLQGRTAQPQLPERKR